MKSNYIKTKEMFKKIKSKLKKKKVNNVNLEKKADELWSEIVKIKDGFRCQLCGKLDNLNSHHIIHKSRGKAIRHEIENGVCLCSGCHIFKIHKGDFIANAKLVKIVGQERIDMLVNKLQGIYKPDYYSIIENLKTIKINLQKEK